MLITLNGCQDLSALRKMVHQFIETFSDMFHLELDFLLVLNSDNTLCIEVIQEEKHIMKRDLKVKYGNCRFACARF